MSNEAPFVAPEASRGRTGLIGAMMIAVVGVFAAFSLDPPQAGLGLRGDESTYVSMALSAAYDGDLAYEHTDLERFWSLYRSGPEGIFLKRGKNLHIDVTSHRPFLHLTKTDDPRADRLYFGKACSYPLVAAPFVRLAGLRGFYILHALLLACVFLAACAFLASRSPGRIAPEFAAAFLAGSILPTYVVRFYSDFFIFAVVFLAYFLWLYKEVAPEATGRWGRFLRSPLSDLLAVLLLALAAYSKPINVLLGAPPVLTLFCRKRFGRSFLLGTCYVAGILALFTLNAAITGEFNYQGGDRKTFYNRFPFETPHDSFDTCGISLTTNRIESETSFGPRVFFSELARNLTYFFAGRHTGLIPYFFPAVVTLLLWLFSEGRTVCWRALIALSAAATVAASLLWMVHNWAGGGGQPGNRYFLGVYPALFFLTPQLRSLKPALIAFLGGALFIGHTLLNPFVASAQPWLNTEHGLLRRLPLELTMVNDLPMMLKPGRGRVPYVTSPMVYVYFLDENAVGPEVGGIWVLGRAKAQIVLASFADLSSLSFELHSFVPNSVQMRCGPASVSVPLEAHRTTKADLAIEGLYSEGEHHYLIEIETSNGMVPRLETPGSQETRYLGVFVTFVPRLASHRDTP